ncbi:glycosyltransferase [Bosea sp. (in: a-proteobacteria)]|uniref:glycosyltransferase n=1 Tax=Bosea sp. (in: a-proteobacteria) TaxID=1871050 RepID=UPI001AC4E909|nr:glycosyltransferase [Bosea sp. (in: a-proteobacteria)]MBN9439513.1 glycosyltransferase [Bosea sp. (in: a-proteobacteria)]
MNRPRRLAYLSLETPRPGQASQTHIDEIIASLEDCGWQVELFATTRGGASARTSFLRRLLDYGRVQFALARRLGEFDAVFVRSHFMALPLALCARRRKVPVVQEINGKPADIGVTYPALKPFAPLFAWLYRTQFRLAAHLVAVTEGLAHWARGFAGHDRVSTVSNGANTELFRPDGPRADIPGRYVIFVGGLVAWHGVGSMLAALQEPAWPVDVKLVIVGDGVERGKVEAAKADPRLLWLGRQAYDAVPALLRGALAALCVIEDQDGRSASGVAPLKLFEAMACGIPVIASDLPFQADIVRQAGAGMIIPAADADALAKAVRALAEMPDLAEMRAGGASYVAREASWRRRGEELDRILHATIGRPLNADPAG